MNEEDFCALLQLIANFARVLEREFSDMSVDEVLAHISVTRNVCGYQAAVDYRDCEDVYFLESSDLTFVSEREALGSLLSKYELRAQNV